MKTNAQILRNLQKENELRRKEFLEVAGDQPSTVVSSVVGAKEGVKKTLFGIGALIIAGKDKLVEMGEERRIMKLREENELLREATCEAKQSCNGYEEATIIGPGKKAK